MRSSRPALGDNRRSIGLSQTWRTRNIASNPTRVLRLCKSQMQQSVNQSIIPSRQTASSICRSDIWASLGDTSTMYHVSQTQSSIPSLNRSPSQLFPISHKVFNQFISSALILTCSRAYASKSSQPSRYTTALHPLQHSLFAPIHTPLSSNQCWRIPLTRNRG